MMSDDRFRVIIDDLPALVCLLDPDGGVELVNRQCREFFGAPLEEMQRWRLADVVHPDDLGDVSAAWAQAVASGDLYEVEGRHRRSDGVYRWLHMRGHPVRDAAGQITRWCLVQTDVDDRRRAEQALDKVRSELAYVARVTSLGALTASIAHEVSQPLSGIITNASTCLRMLGADPPNVEGARETARRTIRDANRAAEVITGVRALFAHQTTEADSVDLNEATREVIALSWSELQRSRVTLRMELDEALPPVTGDRVQLQQVILNLLLNAADAVSDVEDRPRQVIVRTEPDATGGVRVTVRDSGVGLGAGGGERIFDAFYTTKRGGMGIGLSISRSIIEGHRGRLWAEDNDGPGVTVSFSIPREAGVPAGAHVRMPAPAGVAHAMAASP